MQCIQVPDACITKSALLCIYNVLRALNSAMYVGQVKSKMLNVLEHGSRKLLMWVLQVAESSINYGRYRVTYC